MPAGRRMQLYHLLQDDLFCESSVINKEMASEARCLLNTKLQDLYTLQ